MNESPSTSTHPPSPTQSSLLPWPLTLTLHYVIKYDSTETRSFGFFTWTSKHWSDWSLQINQSVKFTPKNAPTPPPPLPNLPNVSQNALQPNPTTEKKRKKKQERKKQHQLNTAVILELLEWIRGLRRFDCTLPRGGVGGAKREGGEHSTTIRQCPRNVGGARGAFIWCWNVFSS